MRILITGGTGSFGNAMLDYLLQNELADNIRIFSRDEKKQDDMAHKYHDDRIEYVLGDVRNYSDVLRATEDVDYVFSAAALKQVPSCEKNPMQAIQTNILGSDNVMRASIENEVLNVVILSTDKAVMPVNTMGMTKAIMEKLITSYNAKDTCICATRYGNVMASRGSAIPLFIDQIKRGDSITITDPSMTRFMLLLSDAVSLVEHAWKKGKPGEIFIKKAPAATVGEMAVELSKLFRPTERPKIAITGIRPGEKIHEILVSAEEMSRALIGDTFIVVNPRGKGQSIKAYTSDNTDRICGSNLRDLLLACPYVQKELAEWRR
jgi:UDP-N-acetylglucosamine 4,6-dehydratase/5-epimerase